MAMLFRGSVCVTLLLLGPFCFAQGITVRVISAADGRPLPKLNVTLSLLYEKGEETPAKFNAQPSLETDANGEAQFRLPEPAPKHLSVRVEINWARWRCGCGVLVATQKVIQKGIVNSAASSSQLRRSPNLNRAVPGQIRFVARPLTLFERLLGPLLKQ